MPRRDIYDAPDKPEHGVQPRPGLPLGGQVSRGRERLVGAAVWVSRVGRLSASFGARPFGARDPRQKACEGKDFCFRGRTPEESLCRVVVICRRPSWKGCSAPGGGREFRNGGAASLLGPPRVEANVGLGANEITPDPIQNDSTTSGLLGYVHQAVRSRPDLGERSLPGGRPASCGGRADRGLAGPQSRFQSGGAHCKFCRAGPRSQRHRINGV